MAGRRTTFALTAVVSLPLVTNEPETPRSNRVTVSCTFFTLCATDRVLLRSIGLLSLAMEKIVTSRERSIRMEGASVRPDIYIYSSQVR